MTKHSFWTMGSIGTQPSLASKSRKTRDHVRDYTHLGLGDMKSAYETMQVGPLKERTLEVVAKGYNALKVVFIPYITAPPPFGRWTISPG